MAAPEKFSWGALRGQNAYLRGQKIQNMPKIADFSIFSFWLGESGGGGRASDWGGKCPMPPMSPLVNCRSIKSDRKQHDLLDLIETHKPDVICGQDPGVRKVT